MFLQHRVEHSSFFLNRVRVSAPKKWRDGKESWQFCEQMCQVASTGISVIACLVEDAMPLRICPVFRLRPNLG
jgi:hypothetical protein